MRHKTYTITVIEHVEGSLLPENVLARTVPIVAREHLFFRWTEIDGCHKKLHIAIDGKIEDIAASIDIDEDIL